MPHEFFLEDLLHALKKKKKMNLLFEHFALKCRRAFSSYVLAFHQAAPGEPASPQTFYHPHLWRERDTA